MKVNQCSKCRCCGTCEHLLRVDYAENLSPFEDVEDVHYFCGLSDICLDGFWWETCECSMYEKIVEEE